MVLLVCLILAGAVANVLSAGGGAMTMCITIALAVIFRATFQHFMSKRQKRRNAMMSKDENRVA